ncbi:GNAT family N-acetyltransferase [Brachyspira hyodysenteriae]|uniref:GNAT family N-acetyltransferase n=1 Tax=Brachyspira hyodysenteriae TaxID=159 RepID=UPI0011824A71|nr:GNAT family N-acetyltransferase [Brachyspira hyodysenteriae]QTM04504.1 GNAT family N-acetyltransferase [Brachyspira hyodysenteriae]QTM07061.1 GNAT family N-acetyltransferase [Brachyspira hyodysenteriae]TVL45991.1 GNAT family acetyltransferase [Brachyspira hyodysenteriae]TVL65921.1 GNAT family acetyltransferase [Brachyspira hyodysenteriae]TVL77900.1 GNAT family acetyltransferase [Brachyspira hyodysenteriae]
MSDKKFNIRFATVEDCSLILKFIKELARYEKLEHEVTATEDILKEWIFEKKKCEVLIASENNIEIGYALFFHNFSTFLGKAGVYLEDLYINPDYRGLGYGKKLLKEVAKIAVERGCERLDWQCLDWNKPSIDFYLSLNAIRMEDWTTYRLSHDVLKSFAKE